MPMLISQKPASSSALSSVQKVSICAPYAAPPDEGAGSAAARPHPSPPYSSFYLKSAFYALFRVLLRCLFMFILISPFLSVP
jgi:hypothetical protein